MSLQVWLPLNGDLHNQGLSNIQFTNNGATIDNNGKLGKCYSFNGSSNTIYNRNISINCNKLSMCCWIYRNSSSTAEGYIASLNNGAGYTDTAIGLDTSNATTIVFVGGGNSTLRTTIASNTWIHVAVTYDGAKVIGYLNGQKIGEAANTQILTKTQLAIGCRCNSTDGFNYYFPGKLNDFRLYDHALSAKEVEEISKGLVLHYKLDRQNDYMPQIPPENLFIGTGFSDYDIANFVGNGSTDWTKTFRFYNGSASIHSFEDGVDNITLTSTSNLGIAFLRKATDINLDSTSYYTISCEAKCTSISKNFCIGLSYYTTNNSWVWRGGNNPKAFTAVNTWQKFTLKFKPDSNTQYICYCFTVATGGNNTLSIRNCKLEKGETATDWCLNHEESGYIDTVLTGNNNWATIYDSSGYNNNGTIINGLSLIDSSSRYDNGIHFSATNQKVKISNLSTTGFTNSYSFAWWEKISSVSPMHWGFADGVRLNGMYTGRLWNTGDGSNNPLYNPGTTTQVTAPTVNVWHHWVMTGNGTKCLVYQDGELWAEAKTYKPITGTTIYLNGWAETTNYSSDNASMSDFRIYSTALTADQVKELYNTSATIDKNGNIYAREQIENLGNINITKTGQLQSNTIIDDDTISVASFKKSDKSINGNTIYEY